MEHFDMVSDCPFMETDTAKLPKAVLDSSKKYLVNRVGKDFYKRLNYYSCEIVDFSKFDEIHETKPWIDKQAADKRVKYAIEYYFIVQDSMRYYLTLVYDTNARLISKHFLPDSKKNKDFDKIINACQAIQLIDGGEIQEISLEYLPSKNTFVWRVTSDTERGASTIIERQTTINACTGKLLKRKKTTTRVEY